MAENQSSCSRPEPLKTFARQLFTQSIMEKNREIRFISSSIKLPSPHITPPFIFPNLPFCSQTLSSSLTRTGEAIHNFLSSIGTRRKSHAQRHFSTQSSLLCSASLALVEREQSKPNATPLEGKELQTKAPSQSRYRREDEERVLISEVLIRNKDGEELERKDLEAEAAAALKACRPNSALTVREVQEDVHRIIERGYFCSCMPVAVDTRDGIRLIFQGAEDDVRHLFGECKVLKNVVLLAVGTSSHA